MLSRCFHFGVFEIFVPNLLFLPFLSFQNSCVSITYEQSANFQEEDNDIGHSGTDPLCPPLHTPPEDHPR